VRTFDRDDGSEGRVANLVLGDETGRVRVTLWDERADLTEEFAPGDSVEVVDGYVRERDGDLELHVGSRGSVDQLAEAVEYVPDTTPIADLEMGSTADVAGGVIEADPKRTFDRDDGSEGQVRNLRLKDDTGDVRLALWGEKADVDVGLGDYVVCTDVQVKEGWQDDLEVSANWRSAVVVMDGPPAGQGGTAGDGDASAAGTDGSTGLDAFADGADSETDRGAAAGPDSGSGAGPSTGSAATTAVDDPDDAEGDVVEFTGTVVQAGDPLVLDDGTETWSVETGAEASAGLGEEVTVRGPVRDGRIHAEDLE
jgi:replication factor A1